MRIYLLLFNVMVMVFMAGCTKEGRFEPDDGVGVVEFDCSVVPSVTRAVVVRSGEQRELPADCIPDAENLVLELFNGSGATVATYNPVSEYDQPFLTSGDYKASFSYGDPDAEGSRAYCFYGEAAFTIVARKTITQPVNVYLSNAIYSLEFTEWFRKYYTEYQITITTGSGNQSAFSSPAVTTNPIFVKPGTKLFLNGTATKTNGAKVEFPKTEIGTTAARTWHTVTIDAGQAGQVNIVVSLDDTPTSIYEIQTELNPDA